MNALLKLRLSHRQCVLRSGFGDSTVAGLCAQRSRHPARDRCAEEAKSGTHSHFHRDERAHMEKKLRMTPSRCSSRRRWPCALRASTVTTSSSRPRRQPLRPDSLPVLEAVIKEGANSITFRIPSDTRYRTFGRVHRKLARECRTRMAVWSVHCHNDLGMAVANSLAAVDDRGRPPDRVHGERPGGARGNTSSRRW